MLLLGRESAGEVHAPSSPRREGSARLVTSTSAGGSRGKPSGVSHGAAARLQAAAWSLYPSPLRFFQPHRSCRVHASERRSLHSEPERSEKDIESSLDQVSVLWIDLLASQEAPSKVSTIKKARRSRKRRGSLMAALEERVPRCRIVPALP